MWKITTLLSIGILSLVLSASPALASSYGSDFLTGLSCTDFSHYTPGPYTCASTNDGSLTTRWDSNSTDPSWIKFDLGTSTTKALGKFSWLLNSDGSTYQSPQYINILGSTDDSTWISLGTSTQSSYVSNKTQIDWYLSTTTTHNAYRYYKFLTSSGLGGWSPVESLWEVYANECLDCEEPPNGTSTIVSYSRNPSFNVGALVFICSLLLGSLIIYRT